MAKENKQSLRKMPARTTFGGGRFAGDGVIEDDYSETSGCKDYEKHGLVRFPNDNKNPEDLNGEVIIVQKGRKKDEC